MPFMSSIGAKNVAGQNPDANPWSEPDSLLFGKWLSQKITEWQKTSPFGLHFANVSLAYAHRYGLDVKGVGANAAAVTRSGELGSVAEIRIPIAASLAAKVHNVIVGPELVWSPIATTTDYASEAQTIVARNVLQYYWHDKEVGPMAKEAREDSGYYAEGFIHAPWDEREGKDVAPVENGPPQKEGDIRPRLIPTWDVIRDPSFRSFDAMPFRILREFRNKYDVAAAVRPEDPAAFDAQAHHGQTFEDWAQAEYDRKKRACLNSNMTFEYWAPLQATYEDTDLVAVFYVYHERTDSVLAGRQTVMLADGTVLDDGPLDEAYARVLPVHRISAGEYKGTTVPYAKFFATLGAGEAGDALRSDLLTSATGVSSNIISGVENSDFEVAQLGGGVKFLPRAKDDPAPQVLNLHGVNPEAYKLDDRLQNLMQQIMGVDGLTAGTQDASKMSGAADVFLASTTVQNNSQDQAKWAAFVSRIGTSFLHIIAAKMQTPRKVALAGVARGALVTTTELSSNAVKGFDRAQVTVGGALEQTAAGKLTFAQMMLAGDGKTSWVQTPQQLQTLLDTGRSDALTQDLSNELLLINAENESLGRGETNVVMLDDNHALHIKIHKSVTSNIAARKDPAIVQAAQAHLDEHIRILRETDPVVLQALGQTPLPPPQPMGMPGAPAGGPPQASPGAPGMPPGGQQAKPPPDAPAPGQPPPGAAAPLPPINPATGQRAAPIAGTSPPALAQRPS